MDGLRSCTETGEPDGTQFPLASAEGAGAQPPAWEQVENGRYMPRRIRGSCLGRELGWTFVLPSGPDGQVVR